MSLIEKLEEQYKKVDELCHVGHDHPRYLEMCDLRDVLKAALDYIRRPTK